METTLALPLEDVAGLVRACDTFLVDFKIAERARSLEVTGIDPDLPMRAAIYQIPYVARQTGLSPQRLDELVHGVMRREMIRFGFERLVNVSDLNALVLAEMKKEGKTLPKGRNTEEKPS